MSKYLKRKFYNYQVFENKNNPKELWKVIEEIVSTKKSSNNISTELDENELNNYFVSVASQLIEKETHINDEVNIDQESASINEEYEIPQVNDETVLDALKVLPNKKSTGNDNVSLNMQFGCYYLILWHFST